MIALLTLVSGLLMFFLSLPLVYRKVPMNKVYGIRIKASFESDQRWYDINAFGGRQMAAWSWLITAAGEVGLFLPSRYFHPYAWTVTVVTLLAVFIPVSRVLWCSRKRSK